MCIETLQKGKDEPEVQNNEKWRVFADINSTMPISEIFKQENHVYKKEVELEAKDGLKVLRSIEVKVRIMIYNHHFYLPLCYNLISRYY